MAGSNNQPLLSTQAPGEPLSYNPYGNYGYDDNELLIDISTSQWYPKSNTRVRAQLFFYLLAIIVNGVGIIWPALRYKDEPIFIDLTPIKWGWQFVFFSYWVQLFQTIFFFWAAIDLLLRFSPSSNIIHGIKERSYDALFSLTVLQTVLFWAFIFPNRVKNIGEQTLTYEVWMLDFICNLVPLCTIIVETVIVHHRFAESLCRILYEVFLPVAFYGAYVGFSYSAHSHNDHWPYPFQNTTTDQGVIIFFTVGGITLILGYVLAKSLTKFLWSENTKENNEDVMQYTGSFTTDSVFSSFINNDPHNSTPHYVSTSRVRNTDKAESLVIGSPQTYNGYGTVDNSFGKGYY